MNKIKDFLYEKLPFIVFLLLIESVFFAVFKVMDLNIEGFFIASKIILLIYFVYMLILFLLYNNELKSREKCDILSRKIAELESKMSYDREDIENYFLLWVHQIKTPITASKLIADGNLDNDEFLKIKRELILIEDYTNMALNYLKVTNSDTDMYISEVRIDDVVKTQLKKYSAFFIANRITLEYNKIDDRIITDSKWFGVVFEQILSNAIKYTKDGKIGIKYDSKGNFLEIYDTGMGISKEDMPKIFDKGYSGLNGKLNEKSTGLGLFLVKTISEKLSISIDVTSEIGKGTSFKIYFPDKKKFLD